MMAVILDLPDYTNAQIFLGCVFGAVMVIILIGLFNFIFAILRRK